MIGARLWRATAAVGAANLVATGCTAVAGLFLARSLAVVEFGRVAFGLNTWLILSLVAGLGLTSGVAAATARAAGPPGDHAAGPAAGVGAAWPAVAALFAVRVASLVPVGLLGIGALLVARDSLIALAALITAASLLLDFAVGALQGLLRTAPLALAIAAQPAAYLLLLPIARPMSAEAALLLNALGFVPALALAVGGVRRAGFPLAALRSVRRAAARPVLGVSGHAYLVTLFQVGVLSLPAVVLGATARYEEAASLAVVLAVVRLLPGVASPILAAVYFPRVAAAMGEQGGRAQAALLRYAIAVAALSAAGGAGLAVAAAPLLRLLYAGRYDALAPLVVRAAGLVPMLVVDALLTWTLVARHRGSRAAAAQGLRFLLGAAACALAVGQPSTAAADGAYQVVSDVVLGLTLATAVGVAVQLTGLAPAARRSVWAVSVAALTATIAASAVGLAVPPRPAWAQAPQCRVTEARVDLLTVLCEPGFASARDRVLVYGRHDPPDSRLGQWRTDMSDEVWVIDVGARGRASLIIAFRREDGVSVAELYHDADGDGVVTYRMERGRPRVTEGFGHWVVRVRSGGSWWRDSRLPNFNLDIAIDGNVVATIDHPVYAPLLKTDGVPDLTIHVREGRTPGRPAREWRQAYPPLPDDAGYYRTSIMVNTLDDEVPLESGPLPWPLLGGELYGLVKPYFRSPPPIQVDWVRGRVVAVGELVASRGKAGNFFVYSIARAEEFGTTATNFENPFAFYSLAGDPAGYPDLAVRVAHFGAHDPFAGMPVPTQQVDFSWRHGGLVASGAPVWDFKVSTAGRHTIETAVPIDSFAIRTVPYDQLPSWVRDRDWDFATFVAREGPAYPSTEGLYEWYPLEGADPEARKYLAGLGTTPPLDAFSDVAAGFRAERTFALGGRAELYVSPVDRKLHLRGATGGVWRVDDARRVRYWDRDGSGDVDEWELSAPGQPDRRLRIAGGLAFLSGEQSVEIRALSPDALRRAPAIPLPATPEQWETLGTLLRTTTSPAGEGWRLEDMLDAAPIQAGDAASLAGVALDQVRATPEGVRFVLRVGEHTHAQPATGALAPLAGLEPGAYECLYEAGRGLRVAPLGRVSLKVDVAAGAQPPAVALEALPLVVRIANTGGQDVSGATLRVAAEPVTAAGTAPRTVAAAAVDVPLGGEQWVELPWTAPAAGPWRVRAEVTSTTGTSATGGTALAAGELVLEVRPAPAAPTAGPAGLLTRAAPLLALCGGTVLGGTLWRVVRRGLTVDNRR